MPWQYEEIFTLEEISYPIDVFDLTDGQLRKTTICGPNVSVMISDDAVFTY